MSAYYHSRIPQLRGEMQAKASLIVGKAAHDLRAHAQRNTPVDTGYLKNSMYLRRNGYAWARIGYSADYAVFVEKGTRGRPGVNMLGRAFIANAKPMQDAFKELIG